jgi:putative ABC transport system permease protein
MDAMKNFFINLLLLVVVVTVLLVMSRLPQVAVGGLALLAIGWLVLLPSGRRTLSVTAVGFSTLRDRLGSSSVIVVGIAGVVGVLVALLAMGEGFRATLESGGREDTVIVMRGGSVSESSSILVRNDIDIVSQAPGIAVDADGKPLVSAELMVPVSVRTNGGDDANIPLRGVDANAWVLRPQLKIVEGRAFKPGLRELVVGQNARDQFAGLTPGSELKLGTQVWTVVGVFASNDAYDSELWGDRQSIASTYRRGSSVSSVLAKVSGEPAIATLQASLKADPRVTVEAVTTREFFARQSEGLVSITQMVSTVVGTIMGIGAIFGALNCMFAAVMTRSREIATLRAIGFPGVPVLVSVLLETMALALVGGLLGAAIAWVVFNGYSVSTLSGFNQVAFEFQVTPALMWAGLKWALAIGFIGGLFPAVRAIRLPVTTALRES